jgi:hypothetical protein
MGLMDDKLDDLFKESKRIDGLEQEIRLLQEQVIGIQRILVETKAISLAGHIEADTLFGDLDIKAKKSVHSRLSNAVSALRGRLTEEAIPEDAYDSFCADLRLRLQSVFTSAQIDSLLSSSDSWKKRIGFSF